MEGLVNVSDFIDELKSQGLVIVPESYANRRQMELEAKSLRKKVLRKTLLTFKEISDAKLWGDISAKAAKSYALREAEKEYGHVDPTEINKFPKGQLEVYKLHIDAVIRIAKQRGQWQE